MNCYYSNLLEGHDTHPVDIERALQNDYSRDTRKRDLQLEARAHITVQQWIDGGAMKGGLAMQAEGISETHRRFCELAGRSFVGGGRGACPRRTGRMATAGCASWRPCRCQPGCGAPLPRAVRAGVWAAWQDRVHPCDGGGSSSVARGLARNAGKYKALLANCDQPRRSDLDGRGTLSEQTLVEFTRFFLTVCIDQVNFMESLVQPDRLRARILLWAEEEIRLGQLPPKSNSILEAVLYGQHCQRGGKTGTADCRAPLRLAFPATMAARWLPGLFPEQ